MYLSPRGRAAHKRVAPKLAAVERELLGRVAAPDALFDALGSLTADG